MQNDITADVSSIVKDWVEGAASNWGFVLYYDSNQFQGVGLGNPELVTTVPEPSSVMLAALGFAAIFLFYRRRRQSQPS